MASYAYSKQIPIQSIATDEPVLQTSTPSHILQPGHVTPAGRAAAKPVLTWTDAFLIVIVLGCFSAAALSVFLQSTAVYLGQTNQLVLVGFCIAVTALIAQKQIASAFLLYLVQTGTASLQDLEAILRANILIPSSSLASRLILLLMMGLPLGLSVAYKRYVGGTSSVVIAGMDGSFGLTSRPGYQNIGLGLSLIPDVYLPFWIDPQISSVYSYNLLVESNDTAAILDMPLPEYVRSLQRSMPKDEFVLISTTVYATVAESVPIPTVLRKNQTHWDLEITQYPGDHSEIIDILYGNFVFFASGRSLPSEPAIYNNTRNYVSIFATKKGETLGSQVQEIALTRRKCKGTWRISPSAITLASAQILETQSEATLRHNQSLIEYNNIGVANLYNRFVVEYDWTWNGRVRPTNTVPSLVATMVWARLVAQCGPEANGSWLSWQEVNQYVIPGSEIDVYRERETLKRSSTLLIVLAILPLLSVLATIAKVWMYRCPIDDGFGLVSILAATRPSSLSLLKGAGLSGRLNRRIGARVVLVKDPQAGVAERVEIRFDEAGQTSHVRRRIAYG